MKPLGQLSKMKKYAIYFLQEVHCTKHKETLRSSEWAYSVSVGVSFNNIISVSGGIKNENEALGKAV